MIDDLPKFLRDCLAEDERIAQACHPGPWELSDRGWQVRISADGPDFHRIYTVEEEHQVENGAFDFMHTVRFGPDRTLAEMASKRRIIEEHPLSVHVFPPGYGAPVIGFGCETCHEWSGRIQDRGYCATLKALAVPYADAPDYKAEWALDG